MVMKAFKKVPGGTMIIPLMLGVLTNTFLPRFLEMGSFTTALFSSSGQNTMLGMMFFIMGTSLQLKEIPAVFKRGGVLLISKFIIGAGIGIAVGKIFGMEGLLGISTLAIISSITNSNGSVYLSLMKVYGDPVDCASMAVLGINNGPFLTMLALGAGGLANIPVQSLMASIVPLIIGMILGNLDESFAKFMEPGSNILIPFIGFSVGAGINLRAVAMGGIQGVVLGLVCFFVGGLFIMMCDRLIGKRPGYASWAVATAAGNAVAVPATIAAIDPAWLPYVDGATAQVAAAVVITAVLAPIGTSYWVKRYGSPQFPKYPGQFDAAKAEINHGNSAKELA
ncbi:2-keto-3-deoxygluconate permease [Lachnospiraceae bacterium PM6-15]|uniref:2-keto-3-deoxygluconate permease n=1 Tax=Ohessyouella blattaphilus TaxID=2949333 RepID=UPI003E1A641D